ncbi:hypothetical protein E4K67_22580 [Desulfosporosinus fructosivorans]|uniref:Phage protein n=1 Tax=Desulfosporosinus fructosivorans TaxID=2018669 RepID=A0A4Z0R0N3_9FIRM|nr:hypothetical protein [Desulfosporosinus fructosivorans]TGE35905.1 hypothetical protein E4K67_22580 [Desulfosporosinus fructosivorans]
MKNSLGDLNNHLFAQLERLGDEELKGEQLVEEIDRAKAITQVSTQIIANGKLVLDAMKIQDEYLGGDSKRMPAMLRETFLPTGE